MAPLKPYLQDIARAAAAAKGSVTALSALWLSATGSSIEDDDPCAGAADLYRYIGEWVEEHVREDDSLSPEDEREALQEARDILAWAQGRGLRSGA